MATNECRTKAALGKVDVSKKAVRIQDLGDKVGVAISQFECARKRFEDGQDSFKEWQNIIRLLEIQIRDIQHFLAVAHHNMGVILAGRREFQKALAQFQEAIKLEKEYAVAWYNLAITYKHLKNPDKAKQCMAKAGELGYPPKA